jgi:hypothetical protein
MLPIFAFGPLNPQVEIHLKILPFRKKQGTSNRWRDALFHPKKKEKHYPKRMHRKGSGSIDIKRFESFKLK